jgi:hypothetical protein
VYFTADIDVNGTPGSSTDDKEGIFRLDVVVAAPNQIPVALCRDLTVTAGPSCQAAADVDDGSYDPDTDPIMLEQTPPGPYALGDTEVTLTVSDNRGGSAMCDATVTVVPEPLELSLTAATASWGPAVCDVGYDVVTGFTSAPGAAIYDDVSCLADNHGTTMLALSGGPTVAQVCQWILVRRVGGAGNGSYGDGGSGQTGNPDAAIAASGGDSP